MLSCLPDFIAFLWKINKESINGIIEEKRERERKNETLQFRRTKSMADCKLNSQLNMFTYIINMYYMILYTSHLLYFRYNYR